MISSAREEIQKPSQRFGYLYDLVSNMRFGLLTFPMCTRYAHIYVSLVLSVTVLKLRIQEDLSASIFRRPAPGKYWSRPL